MASRHDSVYRSYTSYWSEVNHLVDDLMEWERKFESGNHPMEAAARENGYVPEAQATRPAF